MVRTRTAVAIAVPIYIALMVGIAVVALNIGRGDGQPADTLAQPQPRLTAPAPVSIVKGSPQYEEFLSCLYDAGWEHSKAVGSRLEMTGDEVPKITLTVDTSATPAKISPASAGDIVVLRNAGCLTS